MKSPLSILALAAASLTIGLAEEEKTAPKKPVPEASEKPAEVVEEFTISKIMGEAHEDGLLNRVRYNTATDEDKKRLLTLYLALQKQKPPQGDKEHWKEMTKKIVDGAQAVIDDKPGAARSIKRIVNCRTCHTEHKPD